MEAQQVLTSPQHKQEVKNLRLPACWQRLIRRLLALPDGRYQITITVIDNVSDWSVLSLGKVER